ncbi:phosphate ABC transporter permease subunit PstC [Limibaculum sp. M0105]|uniref:Phosphate transport system permease protein n=1 Tax=Thermohalobaculum xanthum TaxID=2753746 RepID=A0A8J7M635_9RHOB|nr:phosphate ABC transporter permease subunit PstC [Thermohalobaculum xanthum]MBK0399221.1 phosphate ABC transporter permease subunit PstC [Thermohalobaculum xanthum]
MIGYLFLVLLLAAAVGYVMNRATARAAIAGGSARFHSLAGFHGAYALLLTGLPAVLFVLLWLLLQGSVIDSIVIGSLPETEMAGLDAGRLSLIEAEIKSIARGNIFGTPEPWKLEAAERYNSLRSIASVALWVATLAIAAVGLYVARSRISPEFRARHRVEAITTWLMIACSVLAIFVTFGIVASLIYESIRFFDKVPITEFLFGLNWEPQIALREDQVAGAGAFGWVPVFLGTIVITTVALVVAVPIGLLSAIYLNEFASSRIRSISKPILEVLAGVPTVVYGFFAILVVAPAIRSAGAALGIDVAPNTALAAGGVMGIMLIPFISSFTDDALSAVPRALRDGSLALGATRGETVRKILFPAAIPGIVGGVLLAVSRAIGETMIVVMAAGLIATLTVNPLDSVTTVTVQIVTLLIGDSEFDNPKTLAAFALGLMLFIVTLALNLIALRFVRKYRELYD